MRNITRESSPQKDNLTRLICEELPSQKEYLDRPRHGKPMEKVLLLATINNISPGTKRSIMKQY